MADKTGPQDVIDFWIGDADVDPAAAKAHSKLWYRSDASVDRDIKKRFGTAMKRAAAGELEQWEESADGALALVILLDQFSRNCFRGTARAFANDAQALAIAKRAIEAGHDQNLSIVGRAFLYHPFHHSESLTEHNRHIELSEALVASAPPQWQEFASGHASYAHEHREVVARFGRFPHRNKALNRASSAAETEYLKGGTRYGQ